MASLLHSPVFRVTNSLVAFLGNAREEADPRPVRTAMVDVVEVTDP
jgi:hypothetical protein